jgi:hypothetical protein
VSIDSNFYDQPMRQQPMTPMQHLRNAFILALSLATWPVIAAPSAPQVVCISANKMKAACDGVMERLDQALFLKRWPADHAISITSQHIRPKHAPIAVNAGTLHVIKVVRNGKEIGTKPVWLIQMSTDTDNLSDGAPADAGAWNVGWSLADALNKSIASGETDAK